jgi:hypothetical protein
MIMVGSMVASLLLGLIGSMFLGGKTGLNYWIVKISRGSKVLMFVKTLYGWKTYTSKKDGKMLDWKLDKKPQSTTITEGSAYKYSSLDCVFVDAENPTSTIKLSEGQLLPEDFDYENYNNILIRALTKPNSETQDELKKIVVGCLIVGILCLLGIVQIYFKVANFASAGVI